MRLYDQLMEVPGTLEDTLLQGAYTIFARWLGRAQCFELSTDVAQACTHVMSTRPTTLVQTLPMQRLPYRFTWIESVNRDPGGYDNGKDPPERVGCLLVGFPDHSQKGTAYFAWNHKEYGTTLCPLALAFDWSENARPIYDQISEHNPDSLFFKEIAEKYHRKFAAYLSADNLTEHAGLSSRWGGFLKDSAERLAFIELEKRSALVINDACTKVLNSGVLKKRHLDSYIDDLCGELPFVSAFLTMLNSKTILEKRTDDFVRLNKARAKNRRAPLKEFVVTKLSLSRVQANRARAAGITNREEARLTLVRGHLKVRKTGVYWWSAHPRGRGSHIVRAGYKAV